MNNLQQASSQSTFLPEIRRGRFDKLTIYEISDTELELLERGSPDSTFLNFAIFLLSSAISFTVALFTTTITSERTFIIFVVITIIGYLGAFLLFLLWRKSHKSVSKTVETIKKRLPPEGVAESFNGKEQKGETQNGD